MVIAGVVLLAVAAVLAWFARRSARRRAGYEAAPTVACKDVADLAAVGPTVVEVCGAAAGTTLTSPVAGQPCVWFRSTVYELYREYEWQGTGENRRRRLVEKRRQRSSETSPAPIAVDDGTGLVTLDPADLDVDAPVLAADRTVAADDGIDGAMGAVVDVLRSAGGAGVYAHQHVEHVIPVGHRLYAIGAVAGDAAGPRLTRPADRSQPYLVSTRTEEQLRAAAVRSGRWQTIAAAVAGATGVVLVAVGLLA